MKFYIKIIKDFDCFKNVCGLTILDRIALSLKHSGVEEINFILSSDKHLNEKIKDNLKNYELKIKFLSSDKNITKDAIIIGSNTIINEEYIKSILSDNKGLYPQVNFKVKTKKDLKEAEKYLVISSNKIKENTVSKFYRIFSKPISRRLCKTSLTPNQISIIFCLTGLIGSIFIVSGNTFLYYLGLFMQPFAIVIDCCDGEVARLKQQYSKMGEWIDTICDNLISIFFVPAIAIANYKFYPNIFNYYLAYIAVSSYIISIIMMFYTQIMFEKGGSFKEINKSFKKDGGILKAILATLMKRASFTLILVILCSLKLTYIALMLVVIGSISLIFVLVLRFLKIKLNL